MEPNYSYGHDFLGSVYLQMGKQQEAIAEIRKAVVLSKRSVMELMYLGHALGVSGFGCQAEKVLEELKNLSRRRYVPPEYIAVVYEGLRRGMLTLHSNGSRRPIKNGRCILGSTPIPATISSDPIRDSRS